MIALKKEKSLAYLAVFTGISAIAPLFGSQFVTGSIVNALLFTSTALLGWQAGILVSFMPSLVAVSVGFLPMVMLPMVSFIILGNIILVSVFHLSRGRNYWTRILAAGFLKFAFLHAFSVLVAEMFDVPAHAIVMMSWPQLFTAFSGGILAFCVLKFYFDSNDA